MAQITQKQLEEQIKMLKQIKPNQEWVSLLKSQILAEKNAEENAISNPAKFAGFANIFSSAIFQRKLAYSFAALLMIASVLSFGLYLFPAGNKSDQTASLTGQNALKQNVVALNANIKNLQTSTIKRTAAIKEISNSVKQLTIDLKAGTADPSTIKEIANGLKTLASVQGTDLSANSEISGLYEIVVQAQIADLKKTTLTDGQKTILAEIEDLYAQKNYGAALEKIWGLANSSSSSSESSSSSPSSASSVSSSLIDK